MMGSNEIKSLIEHCKCPVLQTLMEDPVIASDGHTYERAAITAWIESRGARAISPLTGAQLVHHELQTNFTIKKIIDEYKSKTPQRKLQKTTQKDIELAMKLRQEELDDLLKKQQNMLNHLQQEKEEVAGQVGPLAQENMRLKEEIVALRKTVASSTTDASAPIMYSSALKPPVPPTLPMPPSTSQINVLTPHLQSINELETKQEILLQNYSANVIKREIGSYIAHKQMKKTNLQKRSGELSYKIEEINQELKQRTLTEEQRTATVLKGLEAEYNQKAEALRQEIKTANETDDDTKITALTAQRTELREGFVKRKENVQKQLAETINAYITSHANLINKRKAELSQVKSAQESKRNALEPRALRAEKLTEVIENQKQELSDNIDQLQLHKEAFAAEITLKTEALKKRLRFKNKSNDKLSEILSSGLFTEAKTSYDKVTAIAKSVEKDLKLEDVNALLKWVTEGHLIEVEKLLRKNPKLALAQGTVKDLSGRNFDNITAFQLAVWYMDSEMWEIILKYLDKAQAKLQLDALENHRKDISDQYGTHFSFDPSINEYQKYEDNFKIWSDYLKLVQWCNKIGKEQRKWPAWLIYAFCEKGINVAWPSQDFTKTIERKYEENYLTKWFTSKYDGRFIGEEFAMYRKEEVESSLAHTLTRVIKPAVPDTWINVREENPEFQEWRKRMAPRFERNRRFGDATTRVDYSDDPPPPKIIEITRRVPGIPALTEDVSSVFDQTNLQRLKSRQQELLEKLCTNLRYISNESNSLRPVLKG